MRAIEKTADCLACRDIRNPASLRTDVSVSVMDALFGDPLVDRPEDALGTGVTETPRTSSALTVSDSSSFPTE
jgi:hypothetical protein